MKRVYLIDTNILIQIARKREHEKACREFLENNIDKTALTSFSLSTFCLKAEYFKQEELFYEFIQELIIKGLDILPVNRQKAISSLIEKQKFSLTYDDYIQYQASKEYNLTLVTLDKDFTKKKLDITIKRPDQIKN
jgi:predicted nucleic acid-binding protein